MRVEMGNVSYSLKELTQLETDAIIKMIGVTSRDARIEMGLTEAETVAAEELFFKYRRIQREVVAFCDRLADYQLDEDPEHIVEDALSAQADSPSLNPA